MILTIEQLRLVAGAGGGLVLDASDFTFHQLSGICAAAATGQAPVTLRRVSGLTFQQLAELASAAPGLVTFDLTR
ncbi:MAG: hypothetical protein HOV79_03345 [Hamadaea sp.]|nr:hypothetical protein [Hamadaea sp.]